MKQWVIVADITVEAETKEQAEDVVYAALVGEFGDFASMGEAHER